MKTLNLDDYGLEAFTAERLNPLMSWIRGKKVDPRRYKPKFNLFRGYGDNDPYIWTERLEDWRHLERLHHRTKTDYYGASEAYWKFLKGLWDETRKQCGKKVQGYYLQRLTPGKKTTSYLTEVHQYNGRDAISTTHKSKKEAKAGDASIAWIWLGTPEEVEANRLERRQESTRKRAGLAESAFNEAVKIRLAAWHRMEATNNGKSEYDYDYWRGRKIFTAIENDGRSYGWLSGMGGQGDLVYDPHCPPTFFK